jgi:ribosomal protein L30/L7E
MWRAWKRWEIRTNYWSEYLKGTDHSEDLAVDRKIILEWILGNVWTACICLSGWEPVAGSCEPGIKLLKFLYWLNELALKEGLCFMDWIIWTSTRQCFASDTRHRHFVVFRCLHSRVVAVHGLETREISQTEAVRDSLIALRLHHSNRCVLYTDTRSAQITPLLQFSGHD